MGNKTDPVGGLIFNMSIVFYTRWSDMWVTNLTPREGRYSTCALIFPRTERHMGNKNGPMVGSILNICIFLRALERHMGNKTDPKGGSTFNMCIAFYTH